MVLWQKKKILLGVSWLGFHHPCWSLKPPVFSWSSTSPLPPIFAKPPAKARKNKSFASTWHPLRGATHAGRDVLKTCYKNVEKPTGFNSKMPKVRHNIYDSQGAFGAAWFTTNDTGWPIHMLSHSTGKCGLVKKNGPQRRKVHVANEFI